MRRKLLVLSTNALEGMLRCDFGPLQDYESDAPRDLTIVGCQWDFRFNRILLVCESATFEERLPGDELPYFEVKLSKKESTAV